MRQNPLKHVLKKPQTKKTLPWNAKTSLGCGLRPSSSLGRGGKPNSATCPGVFGGTAAAVGELKPPAPEFPGHGAQKASCRLSRGKAYTGAAKGRTESRLETRAGNPGCLEPLSSPGSQPGSRCGLRGAARVAIPGRTAPQPVLCSPPQRPAPTLRTWAGGGRSAAPGATWLRGTQGATRGRWGPGGGRTSRLGSASPRRPGPPPPRGLLPGTTPVPAGTVRAARRSVCCTAFHFICACSPIALRPASPEPSASSACLGRCHRQPSTISTRPGSTAPETEVRVLLSARSPLGHLGQATYPRFLPLQNGQ